MINPLRYVLCLTFLPYCSLQHITVLARRANHTVLQYYTIVVGSGAHNINIVTLSSPTSSVKHTQGNQ